MRRVRHWCRIRGYLLECACETVGIPREKCARRVGEEFPFARDSEVDELRRDWREYNPHDSDNDEQWMSPTVLIATPTEKTHAQKYIRNDREDAGKYHRDRHHENVAVANMCELMRDDTLQLAPLEPRKEPGRDSYDRMLF